MRRQTLVGSVVAVVVVLAGCTAEPDVGGNAWIVDPAAFGAPAAMTYQAPDEAPRITEVPLEVSDSVGAALEAAGSPTPEPNAPAETVPDILTAEPSAEVPVPDAGDALQLDTVDEQERATGPAVVKDVTFQTVAVTWPVETQNPPELQARVRSSEDGSWGDWFPLRADDNAPDPGTADAYHETRAGTETVHVGEADAIQVATVGNAVESLDGDDVQLTLIGSPKPAPTGDAQAQQAVYRPDGSLATVTADQAVGGSVVLTASKPGMITRAQWGAAAPSCTMSSASKLVAGVVHHTAGSNSYATQAAAMQQIRNDQAYHMKTRGWCDLGYNFVVDKWGNLYEGRAGSMDSAVIGVHAGGFNTGTVGVSVLGTFSTISMPQAVVDTVGRILGWKLGLAGVNPAGSMSYKTGGGENSRYPAGATVSLRTIFGHRDVAYTECPGNVGYTQLDAIRSVAAASLGSVMPYPEAAAIVNALYRDLLGRGVDPTGLATWTQALTAGRSSADLVRTLTVSTEYFRLRATDAYRTVLGREPDSAGLTSNVYLLDQARMHVDDVALQFLGSPEFFSRSGGTDEGFVAAMYRNVLGRDAAPGEVQLWAERIPSLGRTGVARNIWNSQEAARQRVDGYYRHLLGRPADSAGLQTWTTRMLSQGEGAIREGLMGSTEYRSRAIARFPS